MCVHLSEERHDEKPCLKYSVAEQYGYLLSVYIFTVICFNGAWPFEIKARARANNHPTTKTFLCHYSSLLKTGVHLKSRLESVTSYVLFLYFTINGHET